MTRLKKIASSDIDNIINTIINDSSSKSILEDYVLEYCEDNVPELYSEDEYLEASDVKDEIDKKLRNENNLNNFVEKFLDLADSDEDAEKLYNSVDGKIKLSEELFSKYDNIVEEAIINAIKDFKSSL